MLQIFHFKMPVSPVPGVLPSVAAAVWTVQPASPGRQGLLRDEESWSSTQCHHLRLLQQGVRTFYVLHVNGVKTDIVKGIAQEKAEFPPFSTHHC